MAIKTEEGKFQCSYCSKLHDDAKSASACKTNHDLIYIGLSMADIKSIIAFMYTKDERALTESAIKQFMKYNTTTQRLR
jgi:hypothetical protein